jgi:wobble nucleotide-excising tRNase
LDNEDKMSKNNGDWKINQSKFQGWSKAKIENIESDIREIKESIKEINNQISDMQKFDKQLALKYGSLAGTIALVVSIVLKIMGL